MQVDDVIVQYILIRSDLKWQKGALIAQGSHASVSAIHLYYQDKQTQEYLNDLDKMHKIVLSVSNLDELNKLNEQLLKDDIKFKLWIEQPENYPTCLATKPYYKKTIEDYFKSFKLFR